MVGIQKLEERLQQPFFDYQLETLQDWETNDRQRVCLYYRTGAGKSRTALALLALRGYTEAVVVAPPVTHQAWQELGTTMGIAVKTMSHATFRMRKTLLRRDIPLIADEFHLFGGHDGIGWKKLDRTAASLQAPVVLCSATPNYNDAERCYCVQHILDPASCRGGFLQFIYQHCATEQNPYGQMPKVTGFLHYTDAAMYLASLPGVRYLPDPHEYEIVDIPMVSSVPEEFERYGLNSRTNRIMASVMEKNHQRYRLNLTTTEGFLRDQVYDTLNDLIGNAATPVMIFCYSSMIAEAVKASCDRYQVNSRLVTGDTPPQQKDAWIEEFKRGQVDVLIGTSTLGTGTDGLDQVCDMMILVHDTPDAASRRQVIGRILPRGIDTDASRKQIYRLTFD